MKSFILAFCVLFGVAIAQKAYLLQRNSGRYAYTLNMRTNGISLASQQVNLANIGAAEFLNGNDMLTVITADLGSQYSEVHPFVVRRQENMNNTLLQTANFGVIPNIYVLDITSSCDGRAWFSAIAFGGNRIYSFDPVTSAFERIMFTDVACGGLAYSEASGTLICYASGNLYEIHLNGTSTLLHATYGSGGSEASLAFSPNGNLYLFHAQSSSLVLLNVTTPGHSVILTTTSYANVNNNNRFTAFAIEKYCREEHNHGGKGKGKGKGKHGKHASESSSSEPWLTTSDDSDDSSSSSSSSSHHKHSRDNKMVKSSGDNQIESVHNNAIMFAGAGAAGAAIVGLVAFVVYKKKQGAEYKPLL